MFDGASNTTVYIACGVTDCRKSFHGLSAIIKLKWELDPYSKAMFVFCNRSRNIIKILQWDGNGFWLFVKRLERGSFPFPNTKEEVKQVTIKELRWLCEGLSLEQKTAFKDRHPKHYF